MQGTKKFGSHYAEVSAERTLSQKSILDQLSRFLLLIGALNCMFILYAYSIQKGGMKQCTTLDGNIDPGWTLNSVSNVNCIPGQSIFIMSQRRGSEATEVIFCL